MTFESKGKGHNNLVLVVLLVKQIYLTRFVVECLYFAHLLPYVFKINNGL